MSVSKGKISQPLLFAGMTREARIQIANPLPGGQIQTSYERACRFVRNDKAHFDARGQLVFHGQSVGKTRAGLNCVNRFGGMDATPERAVYPPWPNRDMQAFRPGQPLRPPVRVMAAGAGA